MKRLIIVAALVAGAALFSASGFAGSFAKFKFHSIGGAPATSDALPMGVP